MYTKMIKNVEILEEFLFGSRPLSDSLFFTVSDFRAFDLKGDTFVEFEGDELYDDVANNLEIALFVDQHLSYKNRIILKYFNYAYSRRVYRGNRPKFHKKKVFNEWFKYWKIKMLAKLSFFKSNYYAKRLLFLKFMYKPGKDYLSTQFIANQFYSLDSQKFKKVTKMTFLENWLRLFFIRALAPFEDVIIFFKKITQYGITQRFWSYFRKASEDWNYYARAPQYERLNSKNILPKVVAIKPLRLKRRRRLGLARRSLNSSSYLGEKNVYAFLTNRRVATRLTRQPYKYSRFRLEVPSRPSFRSRYKRKNRHIRKTIKSLRHPKILLLKSYLRSRNLSTIEQVAMFKKFLVQYKKKIRRRRRKFKKPHLTKDYRVTGPLSSPSLESFTEYASLFVSDTAFGHPYGLNFWSNPDFFWDEWEPLFLKQQNGSSSDFGDNDYFGYERFFAKPIAARYDEDHRLTSKKSKDAILWAEDRRTKLRWHRKTEFVFSRRFIKYYVNLIHDDTEEPEWTAVPGKKPRSHDLSMGDGPGGAADENEEFDLIPSFEENGFMEDLNQPYSLYDWYTLQRVNSLFSDYKVTFPHENPNVDYDPIDLDDEGPYGYLDIDPVYPEARSGKEAFSRIFYRDEDYFNFPYLNKTFKAEQQMEDEIEFFFDSTFHSMTKKVSKFWSDRISQTPLLKMFDLFFNKEHGDKQSRAFFYDERALNRKFGKSKKETTAAAINVDVPFYDSWCVLVSFFLAFVVVLSISLLTIIVNYKLSPGFQKWLGHPFEFWTDYGLPNHSLHKPRTSRHPPTRIYSDFFSLLENARDHIEPYFSKDKEAQVQADYNERPLEPFFELLKSMIFSEPSGPPRLPVLEEPKFTEMLDAYEDVMAYTANNQPSEYLIDTVPNWKRKTDILRTFDIADIIENMDPNKYDDQFHRLLTEGNDFYLLDRKLRGQYIPGIEKFFTEEFFRIESEPPPLSFDSYNYIYKNYKPRSELNDSINMFLGKEKDSKFRYFFYTTWDDQGLRDASNLKRIEAFKVSKLVSGIHNVPNRDRDLPSLLTLTRTDLPKLSNRIFRDQRWPNPDYFFRRSLPQRFFRNSFPPLRAKENFPLTSILFDREKMPLFGSPRRFFSPGGLSKVVYKSRIMRNANLAQNYSLSVKVFTVMTSFSRKYTWYFDNLRLGFFSFKPKILRAHQWVDPLFSNDVEAFKFRDRDPLKALHSNSIRSYKPKISFSEKKRQYPLLHNKVSLFQRSPGGIYELNVADGKGAGKFIKSTPTFKSISSLDPDSKDIKTFTADEHKSSERLQMVNDLAAARYPSVRPPLTTRFFAERPHLRTSLQVCDMVKYDFNREPGLGSYDFFCLDDDFKIWRRMKRQKLLYDTAKYRPSFDVDVSRRELRRIGLNGGYGDAAARPMSSTRDRLGMVYRSNAYNHFLTGILPFSIDMSNINLKISDQPFGRQSLPYIRITKDFLDFNKDVENRRLYLLMDMMSNAYLKTYSPSLGYKSYWHSKINLDSTTRVHKSLLQMNSNYQASFFLNIPARWETYLNHIWLSNLEDPYRTTTALFESKEDILKGYGGYPGLVSVYSLQQFIADRFPRVNWILVRNLFVVIGLFYIFANHDAWLRHSYFKNVGFLSFTNSRITSSVNSNKQRDDNPRIAKPYSLKRHFNVALFKKHDKNDVHKQMLRTSMPEPFEGGKVYNSYKHLLRPKSFKNLIYKTALSQDRNISWPVLEPKFKKNAKLGSLAKFALTSYAFLWSSPFVLPATHSNLRHKKFKSSVLSFFSFKPNTKIRYTKTSLPYNLSNPNYLAGFSSFSGHKGSDMSRNLYDHDDQFGINIEFEDSIGFAKSLKSPYLRKGVSPYRSDFTADENHLLDRFPTVKETLSEDNSQFHNRRVQWSNFCARRREEMLLFTKKSKHKPFNQERLRSYLMELSRMHYKSDISLISSKPEIVSSSFAESLIIEDLAAYNSRFIDQSLPFSQELLEKQTNNVGIVADIDEDDIDEDLISMDDDSNEMPTVAQLYDQSDYEDNVETLFTDLMAKLTPPESLVEITVNSLLQPNSRPFIERSLKPTASTNSYLICSELVNYKMWRTQSLDFYTLDLPTYEFYLTDNEYGEQEQLAESLNFSLTNPGLPIQYSASFLVPYSFPRFMTRLDKATDIWINNNSTDYFKPIEDKVFDPEDPEGLDIGPFLIERSFNSTPEDFKERRYSLSQYQNYFKDVHSDMYPEDIFQSYDPYAGDLSFRNAVGLVAEEFFNTGISQSFVSPSALIQQYRTEEESDDQLFEVNSHYRWRFLSSEYLLTLLIRPDEFKFTQLKAFKSFSTQPELFLLAENFNFNNFLESSIRHSYFSDFGSDSDLVNDFIAHLPKTYEPLTEFEDYEIFIENGEEDDEGGDEDNDEYEYTGDQDDDNVEDDFDDQQSTIEVEAMFDYEDELAGMELALHNVDISNFSVDDEDFRLDTKSRSTTSSVYVSGSNKHSDQVGLATLPIKNLNSEDLIPYLNDTGSVRYRSSYWEKMPDTSGAPIDLDLVDIMIPISQNKTVHAFERNDNVIFNDTFDKLAGFIPKEVASRATNDLLLLRREVIARGMVKSVSRRVSNIYSETVSNRDLIQYLALIRAPSLAFSIHKIRYGIIHDLETVQTSGADELTDYEGELELLDQFELNYDLGVDKKRNIYSTKYDMDKLKNNFRVENYDSIYNLFVRDTNSLKFYAMNALYFDDVDKRSYRSHH